MTIEVHMQNFLSFEDAKITLGQPGLTLIEGENGFGKSGIFDAVSFAFYGRCLRPKYGGDDVIRLGSKGGCMVAVKTTSASGQNICIRRHRKHKKYRNLVIVEVDGEEVSRGTSTKTNELIAELIGKDFSTFLQTDAFTAREEVRSFYAASDAERKSLLSQLLDLTIYERAERVARTRAKDIRREVERIEREVEKKSSRLEERREHLESLDNRKPRSVGLEQLSRLKAARTVVSASIEDVRKEIGELTLERDVASSRHRQKPEDVASMSQLAGELRREEASLSADLRSVDKRVASLEKSKDGECPTCGQPIKVSDELLQELRRERESIKNCVLAKQLDLRVVEDEIALLQRVYVVCSDADRQEKSVLNSELREAKGRLRDLENRKDILESALRDTMQASKEDAEEREKLAEGVRNLEDLLNELTQCQEVKMKELGRVEFWVDGFSSQGIRSLLLDSWLAEVSRSSTSYCRSVFGSDVRVWLSATSKLKTSGEEREKISIDVSIPNLAQRYEGASKGQKRRLDLCLLLGLRDVIGKKSGVDLGCLFVDELFDGIDEVGREVLSGLLRDMSSKHPVVLVTHDGGLKSVADRVVSVDLDDNGISRIC